MTPMKIRIIIAIYIIVAIGTFGRVANNRAVNPMAQELAPFICLCWPFYWSWELQRP